jgi:hypothetical protein
MICEGARFTFGHADVISAWEKEQGDHLGSTSIDLTVKWKFTSCTLIVWKREKDKGNKDPNWDKIREVAQLKKLWESQN